MTALNRHPTLRERISAFVRNTAWAAWLALVGVLIGFLGPPLYRVVVGKKPTIPAQLEAERRDAASRHLHTVVNRRVDLRGTGTPSYLLVFRHDSFGSPNPVSDPLSVSDEIRIYDAVDGELHLHFRFRPALIKEDDRDPHGLAHLFQLSAARDLDRNGRPEILGAYLPYFMNAALPHPILIQWDEATGQYQLHPILSTPPVLTAKAPSTDSYGIGPWRRYHTSTELRDPRSGVILRAFPTDAIAIAYGRAGNAVLLASYVVRQRFHSDPSTVELAVWRLDFQRPTPVIWQCRLFRGEPVRFTPEAEFATPQQLRAQWHRHLSRFACGA
jgi:hypothetical protein